MACVMATRTRLSDRLLRVVHGEDDVVGRIAQDDLEARVLFEVDHVLGPRPKAETSMSPI